MRKSSVETLSPRSHCCSSFERSAASTSARRFIAEATSHRLLRPPCVARPRMQFELLSSDCANFPTHCLGTVALFGNSGAAASPLALCFGSLAACSRFCSTGICSPVTGLGPFGSVAARWRLARSAVVSFRLSIYWGSSVRRRRRQLQPGVGSDSRTLRFSNVLLWDASTSRDVVEKGFCNCGPQLVYFDTVDAIRSSHQTYSGRTADS